MSLWCSRDEWAHSALPRLRRSSSRMSEDYVEKDGTGNYVRTHHGFWMNWLLMQNLAMMKRAVRKDWDGLFIVDGREGAGKSVMAQQMAKFCDPTFELGRICFTPAEFMDAITAATPGQAIVYDESRGGLNARRTMSGINVTLTNLLAQIRQKNLFVFIVIPTVFDLDKNVAIWRSRGLIHITAEVVKNDDTGQADIERGYFKFYGEAALTQLYIKGKRYYDYSVQNPDFEGRFGAGYQVDEAAYRERKRQVLEAVGKGAAKTQEILDYLRMVWINLCAKRGWAYARDLRDDFADACETKIRVLYMWEADAIEEQRLPPHDGKGGRPRKVDDTKV